MAFDNLKQSGALSLSLPSLHEPSTIKEQINCLSSPVLGTTDYPKRDYGYSALHTAIISRDLLSVKSFIARGCSLEARDSMDFTALHLASLQGNVEIVKTLLKARCDVDCETKEGMTPLHVAAKLQSQEEIIEVLLLSGCKVNARNKVGRTSLHVAAKLGKHDNMKVLLDGGANPRLRDKFGLTALELARKYNWEKCVDILLYYKPCRDRIGNSEQHEISSCLPNRLPLVLETREAEEHLCICCTVDSNNQRCKRISLSQRLHLADKRSKQCCHAVKNTNLIKSNRKLDKRGLGAQINDNTQSNHSCDKKIASKIDTTVVPEIKHENTPGSPTPKLPSIAPISLECDCVQQNGKNYKKEEKSSLLTKTTTPSVKFCKPLSSTSKPEKLPILPLKVQPRGVLLSQKGTVSPSPAFSQNILGFRRRLFTWPESLSESALIIRGLRTKIDECHFPILLNELRNSNSRQNHLALLPNSATITNRFYENRRLARTNTILNPQLSARAFMKICALASNNTKVLYKLCDALFHQIFVRFHLNPEAVAACLFRESKCLQTNGLETCKRFSKESKVMECISQEYLSFLDGLGYIIDRPYTPQTFSNALLGYMLEDASTIILMLNSENVTLNKLLEKCLLHSTQQGLHDADRIAALFLRVSNTMRRYPSLLCKFVDILLSLVFNCKSFPLSSFATRVLTRMGLLKDEVPVEIIDEVEGPLIALDHVFGQAYFPRSSASIFVAFLSRQCVQLTKYGELHAKALKSALLKEIVPQSTEEASGCLGRGLKRICDTLAPLEYWETAYQCSDVFFSKVLNELNCSPWNVGESILVYLGLLKSEFAVEVVREMRAGLKILRYLVKQNCFSESTSDLFTVFLRKPNERLASCADEVEALLKLFADT